MVGHAQASYYEALLEAGVRIWLYPAPFVLHSKRFTVDDDVAVIGSSNMDLRSFALNYEIIVMLVGGDAIADLRAIEDANRALRAGRSRRRSGASAFGPVRGGMSTRSMRLTFALQ